MKRNIQKFQWIERRWKNVLKRNRSMQTWPTYVWIISSIWSLKESSFNRLEGLGEVDQGMGCFRTHEKCGCLGGLAAMRLFSDQMHFRRTGMSWYVFFYVHLPVYLFLLFLLFFLFLFRILRRPSTNFEYWGFFTDFCVLWSSFPKKVFAQNCTGRPIMLIDTDVRTVCRDCLTPWSRPNSVTVAPLRRWSYLGHLSIVFADLCA